MRTQPATLREALGDQTRLNTTAFRDEEAQQAIEVRHAEKDAPIVEADCSIGVPIAVQAARASEFQVFVDGVEISSVAAWVCGLPVRLGHLAAAAVGRNDREMNEVVSERFETVILVPDALPEEKKQNVRDFAGSNCRVLFVDSRSETEAFPRDWHLVLREAVSKRREELERDVIVETLQLKTGAWVAVDGGIAKMRPDLRDASRVVGLVKSHRHYYFTPETVATTVFPLPAGHRTPVFEARISDDRPPSYSWYLRLHASDEGPPWFGLVRVEMCDREAALRHVEEISAWLLAERSPISFPDARYDRLVYPIRFIEQYLRSRRPSAWQLRALIGCI